MIIGRVTGRDTGIVAEIVDIFLEDKTRWLQHLDFDVSSIEPIWLFLGRGPDFQLKLLADK